MGIEIFKAPKKTIKSGNIAQNINVQKYTGNRQTPVKIFYKSIIEY
jgi:hypothetical protein